MIIAYSSKIVCNKIWYNIIMDMDIEYSLSKLIIVNKDNFIIESRPPTK